MWAEGVLGEPWLWGSWQEGTWEQDGPEGKQAWLRRLFTEPAGFHGNVGFLFLKNGALQQLLGV